MSLAEQYELIDFGSGRKLERFGSYVLDRPCPAAEKHARSYDEVWKSADGDFRRSADGSGRWTLSDAMPETWTMTCDIGKLELKPSDSGQVGLFPEQADNWRWISKQIQSAKRRLKVLNLFAYTGAATIAAASAGAEVSHVDAARVSVDRARRNAQLSGLSDRPIRWLVEDALRFVRREVRRGQRYDAVILDPPSYGHGPKGEVWKINNDLLPLLELCAELTEAQRAFVLLTCHSPGFGPAELQAYLSSVFIGNCQGGVTTKRLFLRTNDGRKLQSGVVARWPN